MTLTLHRHDTLAEAYHTLGRHELRAARAMLTRTVLALAEQTSIDTGVIPVPGAIAPNTWEELQAAWDIAAFTNELPVWNGACDTSIYRTPRANHAFRFWHDMGHLAHGLDFSTRGELALQNVHHIPEFRHALESIPVNRWHDVPGARPLALELYVADTIGQVEYVDRWGKFPTNQLAFDVTYVIDPSGALAAGER